jgi:hypothetical protein
MADQSVKHTPGPWQISYSKSGYPYQIDAPNGRTGPGGITSITRWGAISFPSSHEGLANARLIAASPTMLEALIRCIEHMKWSTPECRDAYEAARAAIAKAEGH